MLKMKTETTTTADKKKKNNRKMNIEGFPAYIMTNKSESNTDQLKYKRNKTQTSWAN